MSDGRDRTPWMSMEELHTHFNFHSTQRLLLDSGFSRMNLDGPMFMILHSGAALRPSGDDARNALLQAINAKIQEHETEAETEKSRAKAWEDLHQRIASMTDDAPWKNPLWEREILKGLKSEIKSLRTISTPQIRKSAPLFQHKFRRGLTYQDVVCIHNNRGSAFKVNRTKIDGLFSLRGEWNGLFPEIDFTRKPFKWMVFPKDISGNARIAYLQFGTMAMPKAGHGHTRRYDLEQGIWREGDSVESWVS